MTIPGSERRRWIAYRAGVIEADGVPSPSKFIVDGRDGRLVLAGGRDLLDAAELVLWIPDDRFDAVQLLLEAEPLNDPDGALADRHAAYHGHSGPARFTHAAIVQGRDPEGVYDAEELAAPNPLHTIEPRLCALLNRSTDDLRALAARDVRIRLEHPVAVGVDDLGADLRTRVGIVRLEWPEPLANPSSAEDAIAGWIDRARDG